MKITGKLFLRTLLAGAGLFLIFSSGASAAVSSQCSGGTAGCSNATDVQVLAQCKDQAVKYFGISPNGYPCEYVATYVNYLADKCRNNPPANVSCDAINSGGFYGANAVAYSVYLETNNANGLPTSGTCSSAGGICKSACSSGESIMSGPFVDCASNQDCCASGKLSSAGGGAPDLLADVKNKGLPDPAGGIKAIATNLLKWLLEIVGVLALIAFVVSGTQYLLASADEELAEKAKQNMTYSVIGVIVVLSSLVIIKALDAILSAKSLF